MNSWAKDKGFDARRHVFANNGHAVCSAVMLFLLFSCLYSARQCAAFSSLAMAHEERTCYLSAVVIATVELIYNALPQSCLGIFICSPYADPVSLCGTTANNAHTETRPDQRRPGLLERFSPA